MLRQKGEDAGSKQDGRPFNMISLPSQSRKNPSFLLIRNISQKLQLFGELTTSSIESHQPITATSENNSLVRSNDDISDLSGDNKDKIRAVQKEVTQLKYELEQHKERIQANDSLIASAKSDIDDWIMRFSETNGRDPSPEEKQTSGEAYYSAFWAAEAALQLQMEKTNRILTSFEDACAKLTGLKKAAKSIKRALKKDKEAVSAYHVISLTQMEEDVFSSAQTAEVTYDQLSSASIVDTIMDKAKVTPEPLQTSVSATSRVTAK